MEKKRELLIEQLDEHFNVLDKALVALEYSYQKCSNIAESNEYNLEEQESFEAMV
jgi:hypothetical protein